MATYSLARAMAVHPVLVDAATAMLMAMVCVVIKHLQDLLVRDGTKCVRHAVWDVAGE